MKISFISTFIIFLLVATSWVADLLTATLKQVEDIKVGKGEGNKI